MQILSLIAELANANRRLNAAKDLAQSLGADDLIVFIMDSEVGRLLPAPGFPQTLPEGRDWHEFLSQCTVSGSHSGELLFPNVPVKKKALGVSKDEGTVLVLVGGKPCLDAVREVSLLLPLIGASFQGERVALTAAGQASAAREAALCAEAMTGALDATRRELQDALYAADKENARRQQAEQAVSEQRERLRVTLASIGDAVIATDTQGRVTYLNAVAEYLTGWTTNEAEGLPLHSLFSIINETTRQPVENPVDRVLREGVIVGLANHTVLVAKDGTERPIDDSAAPIRDTSGNMIGVVLVFRDVTEQRKAEQDIQLLNQTLEQRVRDRTTELSNANAELAKASQAKSEFLTTMSHELRTPLNGILGMNELLLTTELDERQREYVATCLSSGQLLLHLINDILDLSKIEAGKLELDPRECSLEAFTHEVVDIMSHTSRKKNLELTCHIGPEACVTGLFDDARLRQVLANLIGNAVKFTYSGRIAVTVDRVGEGGRRGRFRFAVVDTGIGIPAERLDRLFKSFSQVDSSTTRQFGGTGLGLSICKQLIELMGGEIGVESQVGVGTTFWFEMEMVTSQSDTDTEQNKRLLRGTPIIAIDDLNQDRVQIAACLHSWGCPFQQVATIDDAIASVQDAIAAGRSAPIVLADCRLASNNKFSQLQELATLSQAFVVGLGAPPDGVSRNRLYRLGFRNLLDDPIRPSMLFDTLANVLSVTKEVATTKTDSPSPGQPEVKLSGHILVAEDNRINQLYIIELLTHLGCTSDLVENGEEALAAVQKQRYNLVLMDCQMPEMDGFTAVREIRKLEASGQLPGRIPIVALTANALKGERERCLEAGMNEYVSKPVEAEKLRSVLAKYIGPISSNPDSCSDGI